MQTWYTTETVLQHPISDTAHTNLGHPPTLLKAILIVITFNISPSNVFVYMKLSLGAKIKKEGWTTEYDNGGDHDDIEY
jgi:hypothetical protein